MGEKKNGNKKGGDGENKEKGPLTFVFKVDCLCEGCASKILKCVRELEGVETVKTESNSNKVTVIGAVDPNAIKDNIAKKSKKKVDVISPQPRKDDNKQEKKPEKDNNNKQEKKPKEFPLTTADLKVQLKCQCQGCSLKIRKFVSEIKGVHELKVDKQKELVTVKGTMDVKALAEALKEKLKKNVEIVQPKKEKDGKKEGGENGAGSGGGGGGAGAGGVGGGGAGAGGVGGGGGAGGGGGKKKKNKGGNGGGDGGNDTNAATSGGGGKIEGNRMEVMFQPEYGYGYMPSYPGYGQSVYGYGYGYPHPHPHPHGHVHCCLGYMPNYPMFVHPPQQMFDDENPNACAIL